MEQSIKNHSLYDKETKSGVEKLHSLAGNSNSTEAMNVENHAVTRRSNRIKSLRSPTRSLGAEPVVEHVHQVVNYRPEMDVWSLEEKADYLITVADDLESKNEALMRELEFARGKIAAIAAALGKVAAVTTSLLIEAALKSALTAPAPPASSPHGADDRKPKKTTTYKKRAR
ncbi:hypothetical protein C2S51_036142 [Perilla frutescens var. frutescens]|nr:hypothetical protein C2S51_036142 [Perilla frutescens var. frutescens]